MKINTAEFLISNSDHKKCPPGICPEYAFIGRSNVGKSSLINMLTNHKNLAKISGKPGKTQLINHFNINKEWYLVDLPGYGFAKVSKNVRKHFGGIIRSYIENRENLINLFVLIDSRHKPQSIDLEFMEWLGSKSIPFSIIFTKIDKLSKLEINNNLDIYIEKMLDVWVEMPPYFLSSSSSRQGKEEILNYIGENNKLVENNYKKKK